MWFIVDSGRSQLENSISLRFSAGLIETNDPGEIIIFLFPRQLHNTRTKWKRREFPVARLFSLIKTVNCGRRVWPTFSAWMTGQKLFLFFCFFSTRYGDQDVCGAHTLLVGGGIINKRRPGRTLAAWVFFPFFFFLAGKSSPAVCFQQRIAWAAAAAVRCRDNLRPPLLFFSLPATPVRLSPFCGRRSTYYIRVCSLPPSTRASRRSGPFSTHRLFVVVVVFPYVHGPLGGL